jgi:hypothetical protein
MRNSEILKVDTCNLTENTSEELMENRIKKSNDEKKQKDLISIYRIDLQLFATEDEDGNDSGGGNDGSEDAPEEVSEEESGGSDLPVEPENASEEESEGSDLPVEPENASEEESEGSDLPVEPENASEEESEGSDLPVEPENASEEGSEGSDEPDEPENASEEGSEGSDLPVEPENASEEESEGSDEPDEPESASEEDSDGEELDCDLGEEDDAFESAADYGLEEDWLEEDSGDWTEDDYEEFGGKVFAENEYFGESYDDWKTAEGYEAVETQEASQYYEKLSSENPNSSFGTLKFFKKEGSVSPQGFLTPAALLVLIILYGKDFDTNNIHIVNPPQEEEIPKPQDLPEELKNINPKEIVDLRKYCSPVGNQEQTGRCKAYAMTHSFEMLRIMAKKQHEELSTNYTMVRTQKMIGTFTDYEHAHLADNGTPFGPEPAKNLVKSGICSAKLWPNNMNEPKVSEEEMNADAANYKIKLTPTPVDINDVKRLLTKGIPVEFNMNTGEHFQKIGRDGILRQAEAPSGRHGCHSMLLVGYIGNYYIVKNSWGVNWGDKGYCYITKKALMESSPGFTAMIPSSSPKEI